MPRQAQIPRHGVTRRLRIRRSAFAGSGAERRRRKQIDKRKGKTEKEEQYKEGSKKIVRKKRKRERKKEGTIALNFEACAPRLCRIYWHIYIYI